MPRSRSSDTSNSQRNVLTSRIQVPRKVKGNGDMCQHCGSVLN